MFGDLQALGLGIIVFAIIIGVGSVVLYNFAGSVASCGVFDSGTGVYNITTDLCSNGTDTASATGTAYTNVGYLNGQLGSGGLAGWTPAIIAISVGLLFLGAFLFRGGKKGRY